MFCLPKLHSQLWPDRCRRRVQEPVLVPPSVHVNTRRRLGEAYYNTDLLTCCGISLCCAVSDDLGVSRLEVALFSFAILTGCRSRLGVVNFGSLAGGEVVNAISAKKLEPI